MVDKGKLVTCLWFNHGEARAKRVMDAMMTMKKIDIAKIETAVEGETADA